MNEKEIKKDPQDLLKEWNCGKYYGAQKKLARLLKMDDSTLSNYFRGQRPLPIKLVKDLSVIFGKSETEIRQIFGVKKTFLELETEKASHTAEVLEKLKTSTEMLLEKVDLIIFLLKNK